MAGPAEVVVVGSANLDVVLQLPALPQPGQTLLATASWQACGGKGANQAVAAARGGARTALVCALGDDAAGERLRGELTDAGVDLSGVQVTASGTGTAYVMVDAGGENCIVVDSGANADLVHLGARALEQVAGAAVLLLQLEVPLPTVVAAAQHARAAGVLTVLNAAPAQLLPAGLDSAVDVLVVNEQEARTVSGGAAGLDEAVAVLLRRFPEVVVTLGARGALLARRGSDLERVPAFRPDAVVDTTGAGDTFCGVLAAAGARGLSGRPAVELACAAASLAVERRGAVPAVPTAAATRERLAVGTRS